MSLSLITYISLLTTIILLLTLKPLLRLLTLHRHLSRFPSATPFAWLLPTTLYTRLFLRSSRTLPHCTSHLHATHLRTSSSSSSSTTSSVLRTGPTSLSFSSPATSIPAIYGHASPCAKGPMYVAQGGGGDPTTSHVLNVVDRGVHAAKRRRLAHGFSARKVEGSWEGGMRGAVEGMLRVFDDAAAVAARNKEEEEEEGRSVVDFSWWARLFTVEAVTEMVGSWRVGCLERGTDEVVVGERRFRYARSLRARNEASSLMIGAVEWYPVVKTVAGWVSRVHRDQVKEGEGFGEMVAALVAERLERWKGGEVLDDMVQFLLEDKNGTPHNLDVEEIEAEVNAMLDAGSETTSVALPNVMYFLLKNPRTLAQLREELDAALQVDEVIPSYGTLKQLPYLRACLDESLRLVPPLSSGLPRITPSEGMIIDGCWVAGGTTVSTPAYIAHRDPSIFPEPEEYRPERWLGEEGKGLQTAFIPFSTGGRGCLGRNITYLEQAVLIAALVRRYNFALPSSDWELERDEAFVVYPGPMPLRVRLRQGCRPIKT